MLNGEGRGPVNDLCVPSDVAPSYAPPGAALVSATVLGVPPLADDALDAAVREQLARLVRRAGGRLAAAARPPHPLRAPGAAAGRARSRRSGRCACATASSSAATTADTASIQGAMVSGRRAAAAVRGLDAAPACAL